MSVGCLGPTPIIDNYRSPIIDQGLLGVFVALRQLQPGVQITSVIHAQFRALPGKA
jgi:hypothetical protein